MGAVPGESEHPSRVRGSIPAPMTGTALPAGNRLAADRRPGARATPAACATRVLPAPVPGSHQLPTGAPQTAPTCHEPSRRRDGLRHLPWRRGAPVSPERPVLLPEAPPRATRTNAHTTPIGQHAPPPRLPGVPLRSDFSMLDGEPRKRRSRRGLPAAWGPDATYDFETLVCGTTCHARGGTTPVGRLGRRRSRPRLQRLPPDSPRATRRSPATAATEASTPMAPSLTIEAPHINGRVDALLPDIHCGLARTSIGSDARLAEGGRG